MKNHPHRLTPSVRALMLIAIVTSAMSLTGCLRNKTMAPGAGRADPIPLENYPRIVANERLHKYLVFSAATETASADQPLRVSVPTRAASNKELNIQYKFQFLDANGAPLKPEMEWRYKLLPARSQVFLESAALDTAAADWRLIIRPAR